MKKISILVMALALVVAFSGMVLAGGDFGMCDYSSHAKQATSDKADTTKDVASKSSSRIDTSKLALAQESEQPSKAAPETKK